MSLLGGLLWVVFETTLEVLFFALKLVAIFLRMGGVAIWCGHESDKAKVCRHAWVEKIRKGLGYDIA